MTQSWLARLGQDKSDIIEVGYWRSKIPWGQRFEETSSKKAEILTWAFSKLGFGSFNFVFGLFGHSQVWAVNTFPYCWLDHRSGHTGQSSSVAFWLWFFVCRTNFTNLLPVLIKHLQLPFLFWRKEENFHTFWSLGIWCNQRNLIVNKSLMSRSSPSLALIN